MCTNVLFIKEENESMIRHPVTPIRKTIVMKLGGQGVAGFGRNWERVKNMIKIYHIKIKKKTS